MSETESGNDYLTVKMEGATVAMGAPVLIHQFFQVGKAGYQFINKFRSTGRDSRLALIQLDMEGCRFRAWGETTGADEGRWKIRQGQFIDKEVLNTICLIALRVSDAHELVARYGLRDDSSLMEGEDSMALPESVQTPEQQMTYESLNNWTPMVELKSQYREIAKSAQARISAFSKCRWVLSDRAKFKVLVNELKSLNDALYSLLQTRARTEVRELSHFDTLNSNSPEALAEICAAESEIHPDISQMAGLKSQNLATAIRQKSGMNKHLGIRELEFHDRETRFRTLASWTPTQDSNTQVLVEWKRKGFLSHKTADKTAEEIGIQRIQKLVQLLSSNSPETFKTLTCVGYHIGHHPSEVGIVYKLPLSASRIHPPKSLDQLIHNQSYVRARYGGKPPLETRFKLSHAVAKALSGLHQVNMLHKCISAKNILFFHRDSASEIDIDSPYLTGFDFSRDFGDKGLSENVHNIAEDEYRHPNHEDGMPFQKRYCRSQAPNFY